MLNGFLILLTVVAFGKSERPKDFVSLQSVDPTIKIDLRYFRSRNFVGRPLAGYKANKCWLTHRVAHALKTVQEELRPKGFGLLVFDCYRPQKAVNDLMAWASVYADQKGKKEYYPRVEKGKLVSSGYITTKSDHSRGSTVDLTLVHLTPPKESKSPPKKLAEGCFMPNRKKDEGLDMGTNFDCFDELSNTYQERISYVAMGNRKVLISSMEKHGFTTSDKEWWHFTFKEELYPDQYFDFDVE